MATHRSAKRRSSRVEPASWLPIDSRLLPDIFRFGRVRGAARVFLVIEMLLSSFVVIGSAILAMITVLGR